MRGVGLFFQGVNHLSRGGIQAVRSPQAMQAVRHNYRYTNRQVEEARENFRENLEYHLAQYLCFGVKSTLGCTALGVFLTVLAAPGVMINSMVTNKTSAAKGMEKAMGIVIEGAQLGFMLGSLPFYPVAYPFLKLKDLHANRFKPENALATTAGTENTASLDPETAASSSPR